MKDDPKFNILFVREVEKHPALYTSTVHGHVNKQEQEHHWRLVAEALNESSANCKEKWKNLRSSLCRHLRNQYAYGPGARCKKSYYLAKYMEFLIPYIKIRQPGQFASVVDIVKEEEFHEADYEYDLTTEAEIREDDDPYNNTPTETNSDHHHHLQPPDGMASPPLSVLSPVQELHELPVKKRRKLLEEEEEEGERVEVSPSYDKLTKEYFALKSKFDAQPEDPDLLFLKSLLPEMHRMKDRQKNKFKMMILGAIETILYSAAPCGESSSAQTVRAQGPQQPVPAVPPDDTGTV
ncbi:uncharacterized protein [Macrobrachium rosenbergii]|uniref:uncharacterized protein isoform X1 n=1 Tax=Macrobrachium rosenbergii TaxID=79674 RepID=UPI0034D665A9